MPKDDKTEQRLFGYLELSPSREVRVALAIRENKDKDGKPRKDIYVDVRNWFLKMDNLTVDEFKVFTEGHMPTREKLIPSPKGIQLEVSVFTELMEKLLVPLNEKLKERQAKAEVYYDPKGENPFPSKKEGSNA